MNGPPTPPLIVMPLIVRTLSAKITGESGAPGSRWMVRVLAPGPVIVVASPGLAGEMISGPDSSEMVEPGGRANVIVSLPAMVLALSTAVRSVQLLTEGQVPTASAVLLT